MIKLEGITKSFGSLQVLKGIDLEINKGEIVSIVGPSGAGKTTLLQIMGTLDEPDAGTVAIDGTVVSRMKEKELSAFRNKNIGFVFQFYNLIPVLNVRENMTLPVLMDGRKVNENRLSELLELLKLKDREHHLPNQLSGGQQQRVSIGRALLNAPSLLLADEPTGNLDSENSREIMELLRYSNKTYHQTVIVITHDENIALQADRILALEDGRIIRDEVIR